MSPRPVSTLMQRPGRKDLGPVLQTLAETLLVTVGIFLVYWLPPIQDRVSVGWVLRLVSSRQRAVC